MILMFIWVAVDIKFKIDEYLFLEIATPVCNLGKVEPFEKEKEFISAMRIRVYANVNWEMRCEPEGDFISTSGSVIPSEVLSMRVSGYDYQNLERSGITLCRGGPTRDTGDLIPVDLKIKPSFNFEPGTYSMKLKISVMRLY